MGTDNHVTGSAPGTARRRGGASPRRRAAGPQRASSISWILNPTISAVLASLTLGVVAAFLAVGLGSASPASRVASAGDRSIVSSGPAEPAAAEIAPGPGAGEDSIETPEGVTDSPASRPGEEDVFQVALADMAAAVAWVSPAGSGRLAQVADIALASSLAPAREQDARPSLAARTGERPSEATPAASPTPAPLRAIIRHKVVSGDTIWDLAQRYGISVETILKVNHLDDQGNAELDQELIILPVSGQLRVVEAGDTVSDLADKYGVIPEDIAAANRLADPNVLMPGQELAIPEAPAEPVDTAAPVAAVKPASAPAAAPTSTPRPKPAATSTPRPAPTAAVVRAAATPKPATQPAVAGSGARVAAANIALRYLGYRYVWGGTSPAGFDCSGLTWYAYRQAGRAIPRDLWSQFRTGPRISRANLQVGDLVFFQNTYTYGLSHVGIYVGGGRFVHAASAYTGVITSSLGDAYWGAHYLGASRP